VVRRIRQTGVHGALIGRAAMGNPWIFRAADAMRAACADPAFPPPELPQVDASERWAVAREHAAVFDSNRGRVPFVVIRKHLGWYVRGPHDRPGLRARLMLVRTLDELDAVLAESAPWAVTPASEPPRLASLTCG
jgi:tRNA-dihydrouridine synthase